MERAVAYEIQRQTELLESGGTVVQETRGWDENKQQTFTQRVKEVAADYRYFPDPDLPSLRLSGVQEYAVEALRQTLPELPGARLTRYRELGIKEEDAAQYVSSPSLGNFFDEVVALLSGESGLLLIASNYIANDLASLLRDTVTPDTENQPEISEITLNAANFAELVRFVALKKVSSRGAKDILANMLVSGRSPDIIANEKGLYQKSSPDDLLPIIKTVLESNSQVVADYKKGKEAALQSLIGRAIKETRGAGNPEVIRELLVAEIAKI
jgi:aspartyl-tRNA(Asn)/glutamyl-tRNA(Gln) amidotransferase subunit B